MTIQVFIIKKILFNCILNLKKKIKNNAIVYIFLIQRLQLARSDFVFNENKCLILHRCKTIQILITIFRQFNFRNFNSKNLNSIN